MKQEICFAGMAAFKAGTATTASRAGTEWGENCGTARGELSGGSFVPQRAVDEVNGVVVYTIASPRHLGPKSVVPADLGHTLTRRALPRLWAAALTAHLSSPTARLSTVVEAWPSWRNQ